jgi:hypothetical protein
MRRWLSAIAVGSTAVVIFGLSPALFAQQNTERRIQNPTAGQTTDQAATTAETETIHGVIAAITAEGEAMLDYRTNRAVAAEATYLTVVGSPEKWEANDTTREAGAANRRDEGIAARPGVGEVNRREAASGFNSKERRRHNVYYVWLSPRTKICEDFTDHSKTTANTDRDASSQKKEVSADNLEVGDHVEIQFVRDANWSASHPAHQTDQMSRKHGRHRAYYGQATAVTICPHKDMMSTDTSSTETTRTTREIPK